MSPPAPVIVLAPDKFKGSLSAIEVCTAMEAGLRRVLPLSRLHHCPMADGGEGTLEAILSAGGERRAVAVSGVDGRPHPVEYGILRDKAGPLGIVEAARIVGFGDSAALRTPIADRTTRGVGELLRELLAQGVQRFVVGLGGSSTNDGGAGLLAGLGARLLDADGTPVPATPRGIAAVAAVDTTTLDPRLREAKITILSDVDNPLTGPLGASAVFGPQKGASAVEVQAFDRALARFASCAESAFGPGRSGGHASQQAPLAARAGAGAAGGLGFALLLLGAEMRRGAEVVADIIGLDAALADATWLVTGEGRGDRQTLHGKAPWEAARRARARGVPAVLLCGALDPLALPELNEVFGACFALPDGPLDRDTCLARARELVADRTEAIARLWLAAPTGQPRSL